MRIGTADINAVIFDMDGTLLDSMPEWKRAAEKFLFRYNIVPSTADYEDFMKSPAFEVGARLIERYGLKKSIESIAEEINTTIEEEYEHNIQAKPGVIETLRLIKSHGIKMAAATASSRCLAEKAFSRTGILTYLDVIITCEEVGKGKTEPDIYIAAMKLLNSQKENTAVVEDSFYAICTAKKAGFYVIGIKDDSMADDECKIKETADFYIETMPEIYMKGEQT